MKGFFTDNLMYKLLSVAVAFLLWVAVAREPELATSIAAPILFRNLPDDLDLASDVPDHVHLEVRGPSGRLTTAGLAQTAVELNLARLEPGERTFAIREANIVGLPIGVTFYRAVPSEVSLQFEHMLTKDVPVRPTYGKGRPDGYAVVKYSFDPPTVRIAGPENRVQSVDHVQTDPINLKDVVSHTDKRVHVRLDDPHIRLEGHSLVTFHVTLEKRTN